MVKDGKIRPEDLRNTEAHDAAFLYPVPLYVYGPPVVGCVSVAGPGIGWTGVGGAGCAMVSNTGTLLHCGSTKLHVIRVELEDVQPLQVGVVPAHAVGQAAEVGRAVEEEGVAGVVVVDAGEGEAELQLHFPSVGKNKCA